MQCQACRAHISATGAGATGREPCGCLSAHSHPWDAAAPGLAGHWPSLCMSDLWKHGVKKTSALHHGCAELQTGGWEKKFVQISDLLPIPCSGPACACKTAAWQPWGAESLLKVDGRSWGSSAGFPATLASTALAFCEVQSCSACTTPVCTLQTDAGRHVTFGLQPHWPQGNWCSATWSQSHSAPTKPQGAPPEGEWSCPPGLPACPGLSLSTGSGQKGMPLPRRAGNSRWGRGAWEASISPQARSQRNSSLENGPGVSAWHLENLQLHSLEEGSKGGNLSISPMVWNWSWIFPRWFAGAWSEKI